MRGTTQNSNRRNKTIFSGQGDSMSEPITPRLIICTRTLRLLFFPIDTTLLSLVNVRKQTRKIYLERKRAHKQQEGLAVKNMNVVQ